MTDSEKAPLSNDKEEKVTLPMEKVAEVEPFLQGEPSEAPVDKWSLVYLIIFLHGIGTLMPWNMFLTIADSYYVKYKMMAFNENGTLSSTWGDLTKRISFSLCVVGFAVLFTMSFIYMDTWTWQAGFFFVTLLSVIVLNGTNGIYQNSIFGLVSDFPFKYTNAVIIGNNFCGTFVSLVSIISIYLFDTNEVRAMVYFGISLLTIACCFASFFTLKKLPFYRYYAKSCQKSVEDATEVEEEKGVTLMEFWQTFREGWVGFTNVFLVFFVTLTIFPVTMIKVEPDRENILFTMFGGQLYVPVMVFLLFNLLAFIGSMLGSYKQVIGHDQMRIYVYIRVLLIPAFCFLNYIPDKRGVLPVLCTSNWCYLILGVIMSLSSGYLSSLSMMYITRYVSPERARTAMMMAAFFLISGIVAGILFAPILAGFISLF
ncbi:ent-1 [Pristionchus pacificus]|uniref:Ent-1 n=1 Tax=Pristionchus pacificus TaxID=54126 RepID=A0A2A6CZX9_PRIPA|nr:ent-1 [Pristionchus pacificus]|eukprot:PDM83646.1 ent-1 [Pristionchus pacificus]